MESSLALLNWWDSQEIDLILHRTVGTEMSLILLAAATLIAWQWWMVWSERRLKRSIKRRLKSFKKHIHGEDEKSALEYPYHKKSTHYLLQMLQRLNHLPVKTHEERSRKEALRRHVLKSVIFTRAPGLARSSYAGRRALALACLRLSPRPEDQALILTLMKDPISIIRLGAARLAMRLGSKEATDAILEFLNNEKRLLRNLMNVSAEEASPAFIAEIRARLTSANDPFMQKLCLELIATRLDDAIDGDKVFGLTKAASKDLRIAALRALSKSHSRHRLEALKTAAKDSEWEVRAIASRLLGENKFQEGVPYLIEGARDTNWWVRKNSAFALTEFGPLGEAALKELTKGQDQFAREIAELALKAAFNSQKKTKAVPA